MDWSSRRAVYALKRMFVWCWRHNRMRSTLRDLTIVKRARKGDIWYVRYRFYSLWYSRQIESCNCCVIVIIITVFIVTIIILISKTIMATTTVINNRWYLFLTFSFSYNIIDTFGHMCSQIFDLLLQTCYQRISILWNISVGYFHIMSRNI